MALAVILVVITSVSLMLGKFPIEPHEAICMLLGQVFPVDQFWTEPAKQTLFFKRSPAA